MSAFSRCFVRATFMICLLMLNFAWGADSTGQWRFVTNGPESPDDQRYSYHWRVLKAALDATRSQYGDYSFSSAPFMTESRQVAEMKLPIGQINTLVLDSTADLERNLTPVKIPVDKGLLGYRLFLIRSEDQPKYSAVRTLDDLRRFSVGQGSDWSDVAIYKAAGFTVDGGTMYESLFAMLMGKRFDAFGRGATEILDELNAHHAQYPNMAIEKDLLLYYPMPVYFWFPKTDTGRRYAKRVEDGMNVIVKNGTLNRMFKENFAPLIKELNLKNRRIFRIGNPDLPPGQPFNDARLWYDPLH